MDDGTPIELSIQISDQVISVMVDPLTLHPSLSLSIRAVLCLILLVLVLKWRVTPTPPGQLSSRPSSTVYAAWLGTMYLSIRWITSNLCTVGIPVY